MRFVVRALKFGATPVLGDAEASLPQQAWGETELHSHSWAPNICTNGEGCLGENRHEKLSLVKVPYFVPLVANVHCNRFILTSEGIPVKYNYEGRVQLRGYQSCVCRSLQSTCGWKMFVEVLCVSFHVLFLEVPSSCGTCWLSTDKNTPAVYPLKKKSLAAALCLLIDLFWFFSLVEKKGRKVKQSAEVKQSVTLMASETKIKNFIDQVVLFDTLHTVNCAHLRQCCLNTRKLFVLILLS